MNESYNDINTKLSYVINYDPLPNNDCSGYVYLALPLLIINKNTEKYCSKYIHIGNKMNLFQCLYIHNSISLIKNNLDPYIDSPYFIIVYISGFSRDKGLMLYIIEKNKGIKE